MGLFGRLFERIKADPTVLLVLLVCSAVLAVPNFASSTSAAISKPGALDAAFCGAMVLGVCFCSVISQKSYVRVVRVIGLIVGAAFVAFELWCLLRRDQIDGWHYLCTRSGLVYVQHVVRLASVLMLVWSCAGGVAHAGLAATGRVVFAGLLFLAGGFLLAVFATGTRSLAYSLVDPNCASLVGAALAFVCYGLVLIAVLTCGSRTAQWVSASAYFAGSVMGIAASAVLDGSLNIPIRLGFPGMLASCLCAAILPAAALALLFASTPEGDDSATECAEDSGEPGASKSNSKEMLCVALERLEGYDALSGREREVISLDLSGAPSDAIVERLSVSRSTLGTYRSRAYHKLGISDRQELLDLLLRNAEVDADEPSRRNVLSSPLAVGLCVLVVPTLAVCMALAFGRLLPAGALTFVSAIIFSLGLVASIANLFSGPGESRELTFAQFPSLLASAAIAGGLLILCTSCSLVGRVICGVSVFLSWYVLEREQGLENVWTPLCIASGSVYGLVVAAITASVDPGETVLVSWVSILTIASLLTLWAVRGQERAILADYSLHGRERARAYLMGRGLSELETDVAVLTALGFSPRSIAASLCISPHTVSKYRGRSYGKLGVLGRDGLRDLLRKEAGFR